MVTRLLRFEFMTSMYVYMHVCTARAAYVAT